MVFQQNVNCEYNVNVSAIHCFQSINFCFYKKKSIYIHARLVAVKIVRYITTMNKSWKIFPILALRLGSLMLNCESTSQPKCVAIH